MDIYTGLIEFNWTLVFVWLTVIALYFIMKHFFFEKVHKFMVDRENQVKDSFENAEQANKVARQKLESYERKIADIETEGREIIKAAKVKADAQARAIIDEAEHKVADMINQAEEEIEREKARAITELRMQIVGMALMAAEKIIEQKLDQAGQEEMIAEILEKAGRAEWQS